ncbi:probable NADPH dehydrogenase [Diutina catenulata]
MTQDQLRDTQLFQPITVGRNQLRQRIAFAPTTRFRALDNHDPSDLQVQYYRDRSQAPGTLVITEATFAAEKLGGYPNAPGIWSQSQARSWKVVNDAIHANGSFSSVQLWALGRAAFADYLKTRGLDYISSSAIYGTKEQEERASENPIRALTTEEVDELIDEVYPNAARRADEAGFDYVELHAAHGYLMDQFMQPSSNHRTDKYGGSIENRCRLVLAVIDRLSEILGAHRVGIRISPWARFEGMKGADESINPVATLGYLLSELQRRANEGRALAYVSVVDPRVSGINDVAAPNYDSESNDFVPLIWKGPVIKAGNYSYDRPAFAALKRDIANDRTLIAFGRLFTSNPDLVEKLRSGSELTPYDRDTFYTTDNWGYNTWGAGPYDEATEKKVKPRAAI